jgi:hypothetical protein
MGNKVKDLKGKFKKKARAAAERRLEDADVIDRRGRVKKYKPKRLKIDYDKNYGDFRSKEGSRFKDKKNFGSDGRFLGGTVSSYRDKKGKLQKVLSGAQTYDRGQFRNMGTVQQEAQARYNNSSKFVRSSKLQNLKSKIKNKRY